jgi:hypothetical protein
MVIKFANTIIDVKINNQQSDIAQNTPEAGEAFKLAGKLKTIAVAKKPAKIAQGKPAIVKLKKGDIDPSKVIVTGSVSSSSFMVMTYRPLNPKNPEHVKAAEAAKRIHGDIVYNVVAGAAKPVWTLIKAGLDHSFGFGLDALSQNHIEASKKAQGWLAFGQGAVALAGKAWQRPDKIPYAVLVKPTVDGIKGIESGIRTIVAKSAAGDHNGAARALGGTVVIVPATVQGVANLPKIAITSIKIDPIRKLMVN